MHLVKPLLRPGEALAAARRTPGAAEAVTAGSTRRSRSPGGFMVSSYDDCGAAAWAKGGGIDVIRRLVTFTDPQAAAVGEADGPVTATVPLSGVARTATYKRSYRPSLPS